MASLPLEKVVTASIIVIVVVTGLFMLGPAKNAKSSTISFLDQLLPFVSPKVNDFTAAPVTLSDGTFGMKFILGTGGNTDGAVLKIYLTKASDDPNAPELKAPAPGKTTLVYDGSADSEKTKLKNSKPTLPISCSSAPSSVSDNGCKAGNFIPTAPDWYTFNAVIEKGGKTVEKAASVGLYNENYVELLSKTVSGCSSAAINNCDVIACKKQKMNDAIGRRINYATNLAIQLASESNGCSISYDPQTYALKFHGCDAQAVDNFNTKFARVYMLLDANTIRGITSESQYANYPADIDTFKLLAIQDALQCTQGGQGIGSFQGTYAKLASLGWQKIPNQPHNIWLTKVDNSLNSVLGRP